MKNNRKEKRMLTIGIVFFVIILVSSAYAFFAFSRNQRAFVLTANGITATFTEGSNEIDFGDAYPISDNYAISNLANLDCVDFTLSGDSEDNTEYVTYEIYLIARKNTIYKNK